MTGSDKPPSRGIAAKYFSKPVPKPSPGSPSGTPMI